MKECLEAAKAGKPYEKPQSPGGNSSGAGSDSGSNADNQALQEQQRQAAAEGAAKAKLKLGDGGGRVEGGSDSVSRRLRERTVCHVESHTVQYVMYRERLVIPRENPSANVCSLWLLRECRRGCARRRSGMLQVHAPAAKPASSASFLAKLGGIGEHHPRLACLACSLLRKAVPGCSVKLSFRHSAQHTVLSHAGLVLWCATVLLFLCLLPRSRARHSKLSPYRARKESIL